MINDYLKKLYFVVVGLVLIGLPTFLFTMTYAFVNLVHEPSLISYQITKPIEPINIASDTCIDSAKNNKSCSITDVIILDLFLNKDVLSLEKEGLYSPDINILTCNSKIPLSALLIQNSDNTPHFRTTYFPSKNKYRVYLPLNYLENYTASYGRKYSTLDLKENLCIQFINRAYLIPIGHQNSKTYRIVIPNSVSKLTS